LRDRYVEVDRGRHDAVLFGDVRRRVALARARALGPTDVSEVDVLGHDLHEPWEHVGTRAGVARLLPDPQDLPQVGVARHQLEELAFRERVPELDARDREASG